MEFIKHISPIAFIILVAPITLGVYLLYPFLEWSAEHNGDSVVDLYIKERRLKSNVLSKTQELETIKAESAQRIKNTQPPEKVVYQSQGLQFGAEASFASLFETVIDTARSSGIRIRSINHTYSPPADPIVAGQLPGYNVCELDIVAVGTYAEFQTFYKNVLREYYLTYFAEIEVKPWENDQSVLITTMKLRLYTKT